MLKKILVKLITTKLKKQFLTEQPKLIICGAQYSQDWDYKRFREIDKVGALLLADISHPLV